LAAVCILASVAAIAATGPVQCKLVVDGKTYIDGPCDFESDPDGSFRIFGKDYFAYINVDGKTADASWNMDPKSTHAQASLGTLTRKGACWVSATVEICARALAAGQEAAVQAAQPKGYRIWPYVASQSCVIPLGLKWTAGVPLVLDTCPNDKSANRFLRSGREIRIDGASGLCVGLARKAGRAIVELQACAQATAKWSSSATKDKSATIRSDRNECWTIPALDGDGKFPFAIEASPCNEKNAKAVNFNFSKE
jgi:hypothetical protein